VKFRFRLERVQRVRALEERVARAAWSEAERAARLAEEALAAARAAVVEARARVAGSAAGPLAPLAAEAERRAVDGLLWDLARRKERALTARGQASRLADAWRARERDRRGLAELEQRQRASARLEDERRAARGMDDVALARRRRESDSSRTPSPADEEAPGRRSQAR
jgi:flagellar export protein FliJ